MAFCAAKAKFHKPVDAFFQAPIQKLVTNTLGHAHSHSHTHTQARPHTHTIVFLSLWGTELTHDPAPSDDIWLHIKWKVKLCGIKQMNSILILCQSVAESTLWNQASRFRTSLSIFPPSLSPRPKHLIENLLGTQAPITSEMITLRKLKH